MRRLFLLLLLLTGFTVTKAQTPAYLIFGKVPETITRADLQRELDLSKASSRIYISRFLNVPEKTFNVVSFDISATFNDGKTEDIIGPFTVHNRKEGDKSSRLPNNVFSLLQQLALTGGRLFIDHIQVQSPSADTTQELKPVVINMP